MTYATGEKPETGDVILVEDEDFETTVAQFSDKTIMTSDWPPYLFDIDKCRLSRRTPKATKG